MTNSNKHMHSNGEMGYLNLMEYILDKGERKQERNGYTRKVIGATLEFDLQQDPFPLLYTKKMFWKGIAGELDWFLNGFTDIRFLWARGIHIWDMDWARFLREKGKIDRTVVDFYLEQGKTFHTLEGGVVLAGWLGDPQLKHSHFDLGPIYGAQWRGDRAMRYFDPRLDRNDYASGMPDQYHSMIQSLERGGTRRDIIDSWNVKQQQHMALPPCHILYQFHRSDDDFLDLTVYQRSADMFLGVPFDIASYALNLSIVAKIICVKPRKIVICMGDAHVYEEHFSAVEEQLRNKIGLYGYLDDNTRWPKVTLQHEVYGIEDNKELFTTISKDPNSYFFNISQEKLSFTLHVENYFPMPAIKAKLV